MRYRPSNRLTDGPTEWRIESLHATIKGGPHPMSGREPYPIWHDFETIRTLIKLVQTYCHLRDKEADD